MALTPGTRLGRYEIVAHIASGGMGEVYRARDSRLGRDVAVKLLPERFSSDPERRQRLEREARVISGLGHPHICVLYDVGHEDGCEFLVMEFLEGETLAARLERGPLAPAQVLRHGVEIADALDRAHRHGIVHRDLKPGNIMLTATGAKLLDFGLARPAGLTAPLATVAPATVSAPLTAEGTILGTFQYMSPEQIEGREADARSDIFALGAVLYEMATGRRAFDGKTHASVIAAILERDPPPVSSIQPVVPAALDRIVRLCLEKDPERRWQSARDVMLALQWAADDTAERRGGSARVGRRAVLAFGALAALAVVAWIGAPALRPAPEPLPVRFELVPPGQQHIATGAVRSVSPDGRWLAFTSFVDGVSRIQLRALDSLETSLVPGTDGAGHHFWSPDSRWLAFIADDKLKKVEFGGGLVQTLADVPSAATRHGAWSPDGTIVLAVIEGPPTLAGLYVVPSSGGTLSRLEVLDSAGRPLVRPGWPVFLPDGRHIVIRSNDPSSDGHLYVTPVGGGPAEPLTAADSRAEYAAGHLLYVREGTLVAHPFDARTRRLTGSPVALVSEVQHFPAIGSALFASSSDVLVYQTGRLRLQLEWRDRSGRVLGQAGPPGVYDAFRLSPDGRRLAVNAITATRSFDIWIIDLERDVSTRFTSDPRSEMWPLWSPDGREIVFAADWGNPPFLHRQAIGSQEAVALMASPGKVQRPFGWSPHGRHLAYTQDNEIWLLAMDRDSTPAPLLRGSFGFSDPAISPDGRWIAFTSTETGRPEVFLQPFPGPGERLRVSLEGGRLPRWRGDGRELFFVTENRMMAAPLDPGDRLRIGRPEALFEIGPGSSRNYDLTPDGQRFLLTVPPAGDDQRTITVLVNWRHMVASRRQQDRG